MGRSIRYFYIFCAIVLFLNGVLSHPVNSQSELEVVSSENGVSSNREERQRWGGGGGGYHGGGGYQHGGQGGYRGGQGGYRRYGHGK